MVEAELVPDPAPQLAWPAALPRPALERRGGLARFATRLERDFRHGPWSIGEILRRPTDELSRLAPGGEEAPALRWEGALFLDLESGSHVRGGPAVKLAGFGRFDEAGGFEVRQLAVQDDEAEAALLAEVAGAAAGASALVTYAGRSFDAPLFALRARAEGIELALPARHFDLYRMATKVLRRRFVDARLVTLERELLRYRREDDLPGSLVPLAWECGRSGIEAGDDAALWAVVKHNLLDVVALPALAAELSLRLESPQEELEQRQLDARDAGRMESELDAARRALETAPPHRVAAARRKVSRLERRLAGLRPEETA